MIAQLVRKFPAFMNQNVNYRIHERLSLVPVHCHTFLSQLLRTHFMIILSSHLRIGLSNNLLHCSHTCLKCDSIFAISQNCDPIHKMAIPLTKFRDFELESKNIFIKKSQKFIYLDIIFKFCIFISTGVQPCRKWKTYLGGLT
jgi:hypothetical protein